MKWGLDFVRFVAISEFHGAKVQTSVDVGAVEVVRLIYPSLGC